VFGRKVDPLVKALDRPKTPKYRLGRWSYTSSPISGPKPNKTCWIFIFFLKKTNKCDLSWAFTGGPNITHIDPKPFLRGNSLVLIFMGLKHWANDLNEVFHVDTSEAQNAGP
jgi:hypothetical protein